ncbi:hypothetical protein Tco_0419255 [Tanacetum coccineum]
MHKEAHQAAGGPTSLRATSEEVAHPQLSSRSNPSVLVDKTKSAGDGLKTAHTNSGANEESRADDISSEFSFSSRKAQDSGFSSKSLAQGYRYLDQVCHHGEKCIRSYKHECSFSSKATTSPAEREKNTKDADTNLKDELVDLLGKNVVTQTKVKKGWKTIYDLVKTRVDQLTQTEQELKIDLNKPLKEQDPLNELNELANKKRKRTSDLKTIPMSTKKHNTWMAFGGNTRDLGSFGEETDEITDLHQILKEVLLTARGDSITGITRRRHDPSGDGVRDFVIALGRSRLNKDLESST